MNPKVSVIFPIYNNDKYIEKAIRSVMEQTLQEIELILIDDGSTDSSPQICDNLAKEDNRITVVHKRNEGSAAGRNQGIEMANGEYVAFVESDDYVAKDMYQSLYERAKETSADIVKCGFYFCEKGKLNEARYFYSVAPDHAVFNVKQHPTIILNHASMWAGIYRRAFIMEKNLRCIVTPSATYSDFSWMAMTIANAERITIYHKPFYYYNFENPNSSWKQAGEKVYYKPFHCGEANKILRAAGVFDAVQEEIAYHEFRTCLGHARNIKPELRSEYFRRFSNLMKDVCGSGLSFKYFPVLEGHRRIAHYLLDGDEKRFYKCVDNQIKRRMLMASLERNRFLGSLTSAIRRQRRLNRIK